MQTYNPHIISGVNHKADIFSDITNVQYAPIIKTGNKHVFVEKTADDESYMDLSERECED